MKLDFCRNHCYFISFILLIFSHEVLQFNFLHVGLFDVYANDLTSLTLTQLVLTYYYCKISIFFVITQNAKYNVDSYEVLLFDFLEVFRFMFKKQCCI